MFPFSVPVWKKAPFIRITIPFILGILIQYLCNFSLPFMMILLLLCFSCFFSIYFFSLQRRYSLRHIQGSFLIATMVAAGLLLTSLKNIQNDSQYFICNYKKGDCLVLSVEEPLTEKAKTYKAQCAIRCIIRNDSVIPSKGNVVMYFSKKAGERLPVYGDVITTHKSVQEIMNTGNPGAFDYKGYLAFQQIHHSCFLQPEDFRIVPKNNRSLFKKIIFRLRENTLTILRKNLSSNKDIIGIAEALLIGYKEDLDKETVKSYSNTGVVHIIAISGLHLGLIYFMLLWILSRLPFVNKIEWAKAIVIIISLWTFSLITGASASVLRSAVMFTCIVSGKVFNRKSDIFNSLSLSAFILLCYNPYFLFDVGFQLSYLAIISIVIFQKPFYRLLYVPNKYVSKIWELTAVTIAAQLLTLPVCLYYFHQFPNYFLLSNLIAVPLSTVILFFEIFLIAISWWTPVADFSGKAIDWLIILMNKAIGFIDKLPCSLWEYIYADLTTTIILYIIIILLALWLMRKNKRFFIYALIAAFFYTSAHSISAINVRKQRKIIVYNIPGQQAIDFICQDKCLFYGDADLKSGGVLFDTKLKASRIAMQVRREESHLDGFSNAGILKSFFEKKIMILDQSIQFIVPEKRIPLDLLIISKNPDCSIAELTNIFQPSQIIFDASNSLWKISKWKKECEAITLPSFSTAEKGAFIYNIE
ncbi:MAG: ComEC/Rec2 family competence protein [Ferruginibacter sp.]|nr:ComEC/Rec2 family competence protein [Ferruginibacter sp.]